ncbi:hypothetical protein ACVWYN_001903 [Pedobacter sp. UYP24]
MKFNRSVLTLLFISVLGFLAFVPKDEDPLDKLVNALQKWTDSVPQEKVYLHMDKPYFALGDTIWFKAYVTTGSRHQLSAISGALYVELITEKDSIVKSLKLPLTAGMSMGDFTLEDNLREGNYRIRSYTQWMRNAGEDYFFDKTFTVGTPVSSEVLTGADYQYKTIDNKTVLTATLNYTDDDGKPMAGKAVSYDIMIGKERMFSKSVKTDDQGNISVGISNEKQADLRGAYIHTTIETADNKKTVKDFPIKAGLSQTDVQFFPEGGNLVNGIASRVGFKATGIDGTGIVVKGKITDNENNEIAVVETLKAGMGSFLINPVLGKNYTAQITFADGTLKSVPLPKAMESGYVLSVYQPNRDSILVRINASTDIAAAAAQTPVNVNVIVHSGGETIIASPIKIARATNSFWLEKSAFPSGIAQFTLFSATGEPLNERIAFIKSKDQMQLSLSTAKQTYKSKERVELELDARDRNNKPTAGNFSVSVIDETKVPFEEERESTIFSNLLLTADLKGYIEKPNYYFTKDDEEVNKALDNLMLTQGYRRFSWKEINTAITDPSKTYLTNALFKPEGLGINISGVVKTLGGKVVPNAKLMLMATKAGILQNTTADVNGRFKFEGLVLTDSIKFAVQARTEKNGTKVELILDAVAPITLAKNKNTGDLSTNIYGTIKVYVDNSRKQDSLFEKTGQLNRVQRLREVTISARKPEGLLYAVQGPLRIPDGHSDQTIIMKDGEHCASLGICLQGLLAGVTFKPYQAGPYAPMVSNYPFCVQVNPDHVMDRFLGPMNIIVDGRLLPPDEAADVLDNNVLDPSEIFKIEVVRVNLPLISLLSRASIMIYTKRGFQRKIYLPNIANIAPKGFNKSREFYSPRYDRPGSNTELPDLRSTIYWNANVKTYSTGKATLNYFNADGPGNYKVIVEGINAEGQLGRQVYHYTVEGDLFNGKTINAMTKMTPAEGIAQSISVDLDSLRKRLPIEKVYLHTDKPYYNIGDTLWFKSYVLDGANLSASRQSGLLYVELDDDSSEVVRRISIPIKNGLGWGQIPLTPKIFHEGGFTLRAYTNWMQNFGEDFVFSKRFYLGIPNQDSWLVKSKAAINRVGEKDQLDVNINLQRTDKSPVGFRDVEVKIYEGDHWLYNEKLQTTLEGNLQFSKMLKEKADGRNLRVEIRSIKEIDGKQVLQVPLSINRTQKIDLQFLPESGHLVGGLKSVVGFKAVGEDGKGTEVSGGIMNSKGMEVVRFSTFHNGMGSFEFIPKTAEIYTAKLDQPAGSEVIYNLPVVKAEGTMMRVQANEEQQSLSIQILGSENALNQDSTYYLIGTTRGVLYFSEKIGLNQSKLEIPESKFPSGITRLTLLRGKQPLNERIVFIDHQDHLNIKVSQNKTSYLKRDSVALDLEIRDKSGIPVKGSFSMAVTDDSQVKADSAGNFSIKALLLTGDLKGKVESPGYYFNKGNSDVRQARNDLMLTQGWIGYNWQDVFSNTRPAKFKVEKGFQITGLVTNVFNKPVKYAPVLISSQKPAFITTVSTDAMGRFTFKDLPQIDSGSFFLQAKTAKGKAKSGGDIQVERFKAPSVPATFRDKVLPWYVNSDTNQINYVKNIALKADEGSLRQTGIGLKEVNIQAKKIIKDSQNRNGPGNADLIFDEKDIKESGVMNLYQLIKQKLPGLTITFEDNLPTLRLNKYIVTIEVDGGGLPLFLNGSPRIEDLKEALSEFQIAQFQGMEVMYSRKYMFRYQKPGVPNFTAQAIADSENSLRSGELEPDGPFYSPGFKGGGYLEARVNVKTNKVREIAVIGITTKNKVGYYKSLMPDVVTYRPLPILYPVQFYSPKYLGNPADMAEPDYRSTIYWEPNIITDANGRARLSFYTSDIKGNYTISMEGHGADGSVGSLRQKIKVN